MICHLLSVASEGTNSSSGTIPMNFGFGKTEDRSGHTRYVSPLKVHAPYMKSRV